MQRKRVAKTQLKATTARSHGGVRLARDEDHVGRKLHGSDEDHVDRKLRAVSQELEKTPCETSRSFLSSSKSKPTSIREFVDDPRFEIFMTAAIFTNALLIGVQTNVAATDPANQDHIYFVVVNFLYTSLFTLEMVLKILSRGPRSFFCRKDVSWNLLDAFIVSTSIVEVVLDLAARSRSNSNEDQGIAGTSSQFRILRMLRVTRLIRGIRVLRLVRFIRALRTLVHQIVSTVKSLVWALCLLVMIIYLFALWFCQAAAAEFNGRVDIAAALAQGTESPLLLHWSTVPRSMLTLFQAITGGVSWIEVARPLSDLSFLLVILFIVYICFAQMAVLNVLTGAFCQNAIDSAAHDQDLLTQHILHEKQKYVQRISKIFHDIDDDGSGTISMKEFLKHMQSSEMQACLESFGLDASDVWTLFKLLDMDQGSYIDLDEFVSGCLRMKGHAKQMDVARLIYQLKWFDKRMSQFMSRTDDRLGLLLGDEEDMSRGIHR